MTDRPQEIRKARVLANFRPPREAKKPLSSGQRREGNDKKHLAFIRTLPCCVCMAHGPSDPHHLKGGPAAGRGERVAFRRSTDQWSVPICRVHHELVQPVRGQSEKALFLELGIPDVYGLASALYKAPKKDPEAGRKIILAHQRMVTFYE
ncbi:MAG: hypothetical protein WC807_18555 [Hyphomicrobium sp.]|jgi:hypothetical protein